MSTNNPILISDILLKLNKHNNYPQLIPGYKGVHFIKRPKIKPSPPRNVKDPSNDELVDEIIGSNLTLKIEQDEDPFKWDGSYLGRFRGSNILEQIIINKVTYWRVEVLGHRKVCIVRSITNNTPCICDELKVYFSLPKLGTHTVMYQSKKYLLIEARLDSSGRIIEEITIDKVDANENKEFVQRVRETFVFRELFGLIMSRDRSIVVRWSDKSYIPPYPVSFYESDMRPYDQRVVISTSVEKKWFEDECIDEIVKAMLKIKDTDDVIERIAYLRSNIEDTIERIDRNMIWMVQPIIEKLIRRLGTWTSLKMPINTENDQDSNSNEDSATPQWD